MHYIKFENIPIWQESRIFINKIFQVIENNEKLKRDFSLSDQLRRASYSIMLNIAEGFERSSNKEFANFLNIAKGSSGEVRTILYILVDNNFINQKEFKDLHNNITEISCHLSNFRKFLKNNERKK